MREVFVPNTDRFGGKNDRQGWNCCSSADEV